MMNYYNNYIEIKSTGKIYEYPANRGVLKRVTENSKVAYYPLLFTKTDIFGQKKGPKPR